MSDEFLGQESASVEKQAEILGELSHRVKAAAEAITNNKDAQSNFKKHLEELRKKNQAKAKEAQKAAEKKDK